MIRDAVIHLLNDQPLLADLPTMPSPGDQALICTNLRTMNRKRPVFVDHLESMFVFPYVQIRFIEIPTGSAGREVVPAHADEPAEPDEIELDEELLRRVREL
ncbi:MAG: hypothetical protein ABIG85_05950 [Chloroflexota bacterium]